MSDDSDSLTLVRESGIFFLGTVLELGIAFVAKVIIARVLGKTDYGAVSIGITLLTMAATVSLLGLQVGVGRYYPRYDDSENKRGVLLSAFQIGLPVAVLVGGFFALFGHQVARVIFDKPSIGPILTVVGIAVPFAATVRLCSSGFQGIKKAAPRALVNNVVLPIVRFGGILVVLWWGMGAVGIIGAYLASYVCAAVIALYLLSRLTPLFASIRPRYRRRELLTFSVPLVFSSMMAIVFTDLDTLLLGYFVQTGEVGIYNVVYPVAALLMVALNTLSFATMPVLSELHADDRIDRMRKLYLVITKWIMLLTLPVFLAMLLFPDMIIRVTFGNTYVPGSLALSVLSIGFFIHTVAGMNTNALTSIGETRVVMVNNTIAAIVNFVLNLVLIPRYSYLGAAGATTIAYICLNVMHSSRLYQRTGIHPFNPAVVQPSVVASAFAFGLFVLSRITDPGMLTLAGIFVAFLIGYAASVLLLGGVEEEEIYLLEKVEESIGVDLTPLRRAAERLEDGF